MPKAEQVNLQRTLTFVSIFYFTLSAGKACLYPFLTLYFRQLGLSATQTGVICALKAFVGLWAAPLWSSCATQYSRQRIVLMVAIFMTIASNLGLTLLPPADEDLYFAACNPRNNSATEIPYILNKTRIEDGLLDIVTSSNSLPTPTTSKYQLQTPEPTNGIHASPAKLPSDHVVTTTLNMLNSHEATTEPYKHHKNLNTVYHAQAATKTSHPLPIKQAADTVVTWKPAPNPFRFLPPTHSQETGKRPGQKVSGQYESTKDQFQDNVQPHSSVSSKWNNVEYNPQKNPVTHAHKERPKQQRPKQKQIPNQKYGPSAKHSDNAEIPVKWEQVSRQDVITESDMSAAHAKSTVSTFANSEKHISTSANSKKNDREIIKRHVSSNSASESDDRPQSNENEIPRSLGLTRGSLNKTITKFLEMEHMLVIVALLIVIIGECLACPADKICDSSLHETLDSVDELDKYKRHQLPSIVSYGLLALIVTLIVDNTECRIFLDVNHFMIHFYMFAGFFGLTFILAFFYPIPAPKKANPKLRFCKGLKLLLTEPHNLIVTLTMIITGALTSNIHNFLFWYVQDLGGSEVVMGVTVLVSSASHIPMVFLTNWMTRKLGQPGTLVLAVVCLTIRLLYFTFLWTPWAAVPIEILCAFSQQALWETVSSYGEQIAPPAMDRSIKSILNSLYHGLGFAIGSALGGLIFDQAGLQVLYGSSAAVAFLWAVAIILVMRFVPKKKKLHYSSLLRREDSDEEYLTDEDSDEVYGNDWLVKALKDDL